VEPHELINLPCSSRTEFRDHRRSPAPLLAQELRVHEMLGSPSRPRPGTGLHEIIALKQPFASSKLRRNPVGMTVVCKQHRPSTVGQM
jgi:hypothetical protein